MYDVMTLTFALMDFAPRSKARKLVFTGGNSVPAMRPIVFVLVIAPAMMPA